MTARLVLTDSGGLQEETTVLGVPCITMRHNTEHPITCEEDTNILVGNQKDKILAAAKTILNRQGRAKKVGRLPAGTGELGFLVLIGWFLRANSKVKIKTAGRVPLTPHFLSKRPQKVRKKGLSPAEGMAFARGGGFFRQVQQLTGWRLRSTERPRAPAEQVQMGRIDPAVLCRGG